MSGPRHGSSGGFFLIEGHLEELEALADQEVQSAVRAARQQRSQGWHAWVQEAWTNDIGKLCRWIRQPIADDHGTLVRVPDAQPGSVAFVSSLVGGPAEELQAVQEAWQQLWQQEPPAQAVPEHWQRWLDELPQFPALAPWDGQKVADIVKYTLVHKKTGLHG